MKIGPMLKRQSCRHRGYFRPLYGSFLSHLQTVETMFVKVSKRLS